MMGYYTNGWNGWMIAMMMIWPLLIAVAVWAVVAMTRDRGRSKDQPKEQPKDILDRRFASGEIAEREYLRALDLLKNEGIRS